MRSLLWKDWKASKLFHLIVVPWAVLFATPFYSGWGFAEFYVLFAVGLILLPLILDSVHATEETICSLPVSRVEIVRGRYLSAFITGLSVLTLGGLHWGLLERWLGNPLADSAALLTVPGGIAFLLLLLLIIIPLFPCYFSFGLARAVFISFIFLTTLVSVIQLTRPGWFHGIIAEGGILVGIASQISVAMKEREYLVPLFGLIFFLLLVVSIRISETIYKRRDL